MIPDIRLQMLDSTILTRAIQLNLCLVSTQFINRFARVQTVIVLVGIQYCQYRGVLDHAVILAFYEVLVATDVEFSIALSKYRIFIGIQYRQYRCVLDHTVIIAFDKVFVATDVEFSVALCKINMKGDIEMQ